MARDFVTEPSPSAEPLRVSSADAASVSRAGAELDCRSCGACCAEAGTVVVRPEDKQVPRYLTRSVRRRIGFASYEADEGVRQMNALVGGRCQALRGEIGTDCKCSIYDRRPAVCREFEPGSDGCLAARERMVWKLSRLDWKPWGYGPDWASQGIEAFGQDPKGLGAEHESPSAEGGAP